MGRPLNKKYFGNRNIGSTSVTTDNGIGGKAIASVTLNALGSYTTRPTITFPLPALPSGVRALGTITSEALSGAVTTAGTGYVVGDLLTLTSSGGSAIAYVASVDTGGEILTVNFTGTGASRGSFEALPGNKFPSTPTGGRSCTSNSVAGAGAEITVTFRAKSVSITEAGSGYTTALAAGDLTFTQSVTASAIAFAADSGSAGSSTNQENAIVCTAFIPVANGGTSALTGDIVKQVNDRRYKVKTSEGTGICQLVTDGVANAAGEISIKATDSEGKNYLVAKLTSRKAVVVPAALGGSSGTQFASGTSVPWTFGDATLNYSVKIENQ